MPRSILVATTSLATLEDYAPPYNLRHPDPAENLRLGLAMLDAAGLQKPDLAVLPETFMAAGLASSAIRSVAQPLPGPAFDADRRARATPRDECGRWVPRPGRRTYFECRSVNRPVRQAGGSLRKDPSNRGRNRGRGLSGAGARVFDTDFGQLGLAICFDINWPSLWSAMKRDAADMVCWISAYEGGLPLQAHALLHEMPIITSVWPYHARMIDRTGRILAQTSRWSRLAVSRLSLDKRVFHTDHQAHLLLPIQFRYGNRVQVEAFTEEHIFTVE